MVMASEVRKKIVAFVLVIGAFLVLSNFMYVPTNAEDSNIIANIETTLGVTTSASDVTLNLVANNHEFDNKDLNVYVTTNSPAGYKLSMTAANTSLVETRDNTKTIQTLPVLAGGYTESTFTANRWGYKVGTGNYMAFESGVVIKNTDTLADNDTTTVNFASKIDYTQAPGAYSTELTFAAVVNPVYATMQNLRANLCTTTPSYVMDIRDSQVYMIQQLKDGKCWMMQNLNITNPTVDFNSDNSNISGTLAASTFKSWRASTHIGGNVNSSPGFTTPHYVPITAANDRNGTNGIDPGTGLLYGTLYNTCAASARTYCSDGSYNAGNISQDICPAGWRMTTNDDFNMLYNNYPSFNAMHASAASGGASLSLSGSVDQYGVIQLNAWGVYMTSTYASNKVMKGIQITNQQGGRVTTNANVAERQNDMALRCVRKY